MIRPLVLAAESDLVTYANEQVFTYSSNLYVVSQLKRKVKTLLRDERNNPRIREQPARRTWECRDGASFARLKTRGMDLRTTLLHCPTADTIT